MVIPHYYLNVKGEALIKINFKSRTVIKLKDKPQKLKSKKLALIDRDGVVIKKAKKQTEKDTLKRKRNYILGESGADSQNSDCVDIGQFSAWCICAELSTPAPLRDMAVPIREIPLTNNLDNLHKLTEAYFGRSGKASPDVTEETDLGAKERRKAGLYTLEEAACYVGENSVVITKTILIKLIEAARNGDIIVYMPGGAEKYTPDVARPWYEESFWNDLNDWLEKNEARIGRIFPKVNPKRKSGGKKVSDVKTSIRYDETRLFLQGRIDAGMTNIENIRRVMLLYKNK